MSRESFRGRALRFLVAGVPITLCDYAVFKLGLLAGLDPSWARTVSFACAFAASFFLHRWWTFGSFGTLRGDFGAYLLARLACFGVAQLVFVLLQKGLGLGPDLAFWLQTPVQPAGNFLLGHFLVFRVSRSDR
jgi:putative flippase GtrA